MKKIRKGLLATLMISGIIFLFFTIYLTAKATVFEREGIKTQAEVVGIDKKYDADNEEIITVYVKYTVGNISYTSALDYYSSFLSEGDIVTILYLPDNPQLITHENAHFITPIFFFLGAAICLGFGFFEVFSKLAQGSRWKRLKKKGQMIPAVIKRFVYNRNTLILGKHPATLLCTDKCGNTYETKFLYEDGTYFSVGDIIKVYVNNANPKKYRIDLQEYLTRERGAGSSKETITERNQE